MEVFSFIPRAVYRQGKRRRNLLAVGGGVPTPWRLHLEELNFSASQEIIRIMEYECSLPHSQRLTTCPHPDQNSHAIPNDFPFGISILFLHLGLRSGLCDMWLQ